MKKILTVVLFLAFAIAGSISAQGIEVEKAIINYKISGNDAGFMQNGTMEIVYDKYGEYMASTTTTPDLKATTIITPDSEYMINWNDKTAMDLKAFGFDNEYMPDFSDDEETGEIVGKETILGKPCTVYYSEDEFGSEKVWIWKGIALKIISDSEGVKTTMEATSVSTPSSIPASKFKIPAGIEVQQMPSFSFPVPGMSQ